MQENGYNDGKNHIKLSDFHIKFNREIVFHLMDCYPESPIYQEVIEEYENLEAEVYSTIEPVAIIQFGKLNPSVGAKEFETGVPACYALFTIGDKVTELSSRYFEKGDYLAGMLVNAMANDYVFQLDHEVTNTIREQCMLRHLGVLKRLESPNDIPMEAQQAVLLETGADKELDIGITEGYMFTTVKTNCFVLILTEDEKILKIQHDCSNCDSLDCKMRKIPGVNIEVIRGNKSFTIACNEKESILEALIREEYHLSAACGGHGTCGKCKVQVIKGNLEVTVQDQKLIGKNELEMGYRLSCKAYAKEDCTIRLDSGDESDFEIISESTITESKTAGSKEDGHGVTAGIKEDGYGIAVDIGTTTIAVSLVGLTSKSTLQTYTTVNKQRAYGADVIARMQASNDGKKEQLQNMIRKDLMEGFRSVISDAGIKKIQVKKIAIAGNTTMGHLLMGYSCETLGVYPFTPVNIQTIEKEFKEIFASEELDVVVTLLPGISTYVGADIVAGLASCSFDREETPCILIDLGTNGEMAIGMKDKIYVSSTAAGPAFEGGNISCGVGSINGAICSVSIEDGKLNYKTIGTKSPVGICGTGVLEITSELVKSGLVDETGLLDDQYFEDGYMIAGDMNGKDSDNNQNPIIFTQRDIREIQLAKAAVRAGLETLILRFGIPYDQIGTVYMAGGFGYKINIDKAIHIGLLPKELSGKIRAIGNSSLAGAVQYLTEQDAKKRMEDIISISKEISLSNDKDFNELYIDHMYFE